MSERMKKLINRPEVLAWELQEGLVAAYCDKLQMVGNHIILRRQPKAKGKVQLVLGQGSGHEPGFAGFVGYGMHDVEVSGQIFACAGPDRILEGIQEAHRISGGGEILLLILNHEGDVINGSAAVEMAHDEGINVAPILLYDDIASAPKGEEKNRRGMAGTFFCFKVAGAMAEVGANRAQIMQMVQKVNDNTRTLAVALRPCTIPTSGEPLFYLAEDELIIGPGVHGEAGPEGPAKMMNADEVMDIVLKKLVDDGEFKRGDELLVLINGCGATTLMEMFVLFRRLQANFDQWGMAYYRPLIGNILTTQEMAGFSLSICKADAELKRWWDAPADTPYFKVCQ
jgi:dihydroxyacetone kinase-like protein